MTMIPTPGLGSIGAMHDDADLLDQITQDIMESRRTRTLRVRKASNSGSDLRRAAEEDHHPQAGYRRLGG
jgi:hypothetical protein